ncbi:carbohydrate ABC transporter permease [Alicyclobacillus fastidiosus]|uniref:Sugar ABC transporter permease n=1 Tax=Alicyclobacillus fastidiosus TaxID=392011 RepID=A0ABV5AA26_9BACL|nr:sugar ABC transporter permease [Alicyclobacillus fastidiosus]WEH07723.1 sugar ABC transporter permease [Alicyclobacillus fastidiosus]
MTAGNVKRNRIGYYFIVPYFVAFLIFGLYPILYSLYISFTNWNGFSSPVFVGLQNYVRLIHDTAFYQSILTTLIIWIISIVPQLILALGLAILLNEKFIRGKHFFRAVFYLPNIVTPVTIGVLAALMFDWKTGSVNKILVALHIIHVPVNWLGHPFLAQVIVGGIMCWQYFGYNMLIFTAGLQSIPNEVYEAAEMDGATRFQIALRITMPMIRPVILFTAVTSVIGGMQIFDVPLMLGNTAGNSTQTMVSYLYTTGFKRFDYGYASAIAYGIFILIMVMSLVTMKLSSRKNQTVVSDRVAPVRA